MPNIFAKISLVGEAETRDVKAIFYLFKKNADKRGKSRPIVAPRNWECLIQRQNDHGSFIVLVSFVLKLLGRGMVDGRISFADHVTYLAHVGSESGD